jgi:hypothetical protein
MHLRPHLPSAPCGDAFWLNLTRDPLLHLTSHINCLPTVYWAAHGPAVSENLPLSGELCKHTVSHNCRPAPSSNRPTPSLPTRVRPPYFPVQRVRGPRSTPHLSASRPVAVGGCGCPASLCVLVAYLASHIHGGDLLPLGICHFS